MQRYPAPGARAGEGSPPRGADMPAARAENGFQHAHAAAAARTRSGEQSRPSPGPRPRAPRRQRSSGCACLLPRAGAALRPPPTANGIPQPETNQYESTGHQHAPTGFRGRCPPKLAQRQHCATAGCHTNSAPPAPKPAILCLEASPWLQRPAPREFRPQTLHRPALGPPLAGRPVRALPAAR